jgi:hypothetical protein
MQEIINIVSSLKSDIQFLRKDLSELKKTHVQLLTEEWIEKEKVMLVLKIKDRKLQSMRDNGTLPFSQIDGKIYYKTSDVEALLNKHYNKK